MCEFESECECAVTITKIPSAMGTNSNQCFYSMK